jgi:hypothetical protein
LWGSHLDAERHRRAWLGRLTLSDSTWGGLQLTSYPPL